MDAGLARDRRDYGSSAALWAGHRGVAAEAFGWSALSGINSIDYNVVLCDAPGDGVDEAVARIAEMGVPAVLMVAGAALGEVARLEARGWGCIGSQPLMRLDLERLHAPDPMRAGRRLTRDELPAARELVAEAFGIPVDHVQTGLPDRLVDDASPDGELWGSFDGSGRLCSCLALARVDARCVVWSMATADRVRGRGHGARALLTALADAAATGAVDSLLFATESGEALYSRLGYVELEQWQMWSRPRWLPGLL